MEQYIPGAIIGIAVYGLVQRNGSATSLWLILVLTMLLSGLSLYKSFRSCKSDGATREA